MCSDTFLEQSWFPPIHRLNICVILEILQLFPFQQLMVKLGISIKSSTYLIRRLLNTMTSRITCSSSLCHCRKSPFTRTVTSGSTDSGQGKVTVESRDCISTEREGLQWNKLFEDEKNIYPVHKSACMVRPTIAKWRHEHCNAIIIIRGWQKATKTKQMTEF